MDKFIFIRIPGIFTFAGRHNQDLWAQKVQEYFPGSTTHYERFFYSPFQFLKISKYCDLVIKEVEKSRAPIILVGLSYGGFLTYRVARTLQNQKKHPVACVYYGAPFLFEKFRFPRLNIPEFHFYGKYDLLIPSWLSRFDKCPYVHVISGNHLSLAKGKNLDEFLGLLRADLTTI